MCTSRVNSLVIFVIPPKSWQSNAITHVDCSGTRDRSFWKNLSVETDLNSLFTSETIVFSMLKITSGGINKLFSRNRTQRIKTMFGGINIALGGINSELKMSS